MILAVKIVAPTRDKPEGDLTVTTDSLLASEDALEFITAGNYQIYSVDKDEDGYLSNLEYLKTISATPQPVEPPKVDIEEV